MVLAFLLVILLSICSFLHSMYMYGVYSIINIFSCDKHGRELRIQNCYDPSKEADDVYQKGLRIIISVRG